MKKEIKLMQGNEAITRGALAAGARFYAGYPITPSSEVAELSSMLLPKLGGMYIQMEDEIASIAAIIGASAAGKKSFTATSGPGFSLMQENLGVAIMTEVPCVIINVQRLGPSTGLATKPAQGDLMQARWGSHGDYNLIVISPSTVEDCYYLMITAFNYAEKYRVPVIFLTDEVIGHMEERIELREILEDEIISRQDLSNIDNYNIYDHSNNIVSPMAQFGGENLLRFTTTMHDETGYPSDNPENASKYAQHYVNKIEKNKDDIFITRKYMTDDADYIIVTFGCSTRPSLEAMNLMREAGIKVGVYQIITVWPFPDEELNQVCRNAKAVFVPEMNMGQLIQQVERYCKYDIPITGINKVDSTLINPDEIIEKVEEVIKCVK